MKYLIRRSFLMRHTHDYAIEVADDVDPQHLIDQHFGEFDDDLTTGGDTLNGFHSELTASGVEPIDYDELKLEVVKAQPGNVIPMRRR